MSRLGEAVAEALANRKGRSRRAPWTVLEVVAKVDIEAVITALVPRLDERGSRFDRAVVWDTRGSETLDGEICVGLGAAVETVCQRGEAAVEVARMLAPFATEARRIRAFGALSFDDHSADVLGSARFIVPRWTIHAQKDKSARVLFVAPTDAGLESRCLEEAAAIEAASDARAAREAVAAARVVEDGGPAFVELVERANAAVESSELEKVVVARRTAVEGARAPGHVLSALRGAAGCVRFGIATTDAAFAGASPEVLCGVDERGLRTEAVAGSEPRRGADLAEVARLLVRDKDRREHDLVVQSIRQTLGALGATVEVAEEPRVRTLTHVHHLVTPITATAGVKPNALELACALHPTPALGGWPRAKAAAFLAENETWPRGFYASPFGWVDARGDGAFVVGIRSATLTRDRAWVYAGAGIVRGSVPELELAETTAKQRGMLEALGVAAPARRASTAMRREAGA